MPHPSRQERLVGVLARIKERGVDGASLREVTPAQGGIRGRDAQILVDMGEAEWVVPFAVVRAKPCAR